VGSVNNVQNNFNNNNLNVSDDIDYNNDITSNNNIGDDENLGNQRQQQQQKEGVSSLDRPRRDEEITSTWIQYISLEGNQGQKRLSHVLKSFDRTQYVLIEINSNVSPPICKLFSKKELYEKAKASKKAAKKQNSSVTKEFQ